MASDPPESSMTREKTGGAISTNLSAEDEAKLREAFASEDEQPFYSYSDRFSVGNNKWHDDHETGGPRRQ